MIHLGPGFKESSRSLRLRRVDCSVMDMGIVGKSIYIYQNRKMISFFQLLQKKQDSLVRRFVVLLFAVLLISTFGIAIRTKGHFPFLMVAGMGSMIIFQTFLNIGVVSGLLPVTGVTLPFISYGGSSLMTTWMAAGVILHFANSRKIIE